MPHEPDETDDVARKKAEHDLAEARAKFEDWQSDSSRAQREAERAMAIAEAEKTIAEARQSQLAALVPDLSDVDRGALEVKGESAVLGNLATHRALKLAAQKVDQKVKEGVDKIVLVTTADDTAASDIVYHQTLATLRHLTEQAEDLIPQHQLDDDTHEPQVGSALEADAGVTAAFGAVAAAVPSLLSTLSAKRTVSSSARTGSAMTAAVAVVGELSDNGRTKVWLENLRLVQHTKVLHDVIALDEMRGKLARVAESSNESATTIKALLDQIAKFLTAIMAAPSESSRSALMTSALHERIYHPSPGHDGSAPAFTHILWIQALNSSTSQVVDDRPLLFEDKVSILGSVSISWVLIDTSYGAVVSGGTANGTAQLSGTIGSKFTFSAVDGDLQGPRPTTVTVATGAGDPNPGRIRKVLKRVKNTLGV